MTLTATAPVGRQADPPTLRALALATGVLGLAANVLLTLFFLLAEPFTGHTNRFSWLGPANDVVLVGQFAAFVPVALALRRRLPATRVSQIFTGAAVLAMAAVIVLQLLLVAGLVDFDLQVVLVSAAFLVVFAWVFAVSSIGHRSGTLPRLVTRAGLLLGALYPVGLLVAAPGLVFTWGSAPQLAFVLPGVALGSIGWLGLPVWPLLLARHVFSQPFVNPVREGVS
ncbi:MAG: hypothetical protein ACLGIF_10440 [Actinomycetes bacterium]